MLNIQRLSVHMCELRQSENKYLEAVYNNVNHIDRRRFFERSISSRSLVHDILDHSHREV